ncbi:HalOD1 output domain-containing protein [Natronococcus wangiae]|uniref:HalOD1 output domain-containing protein n=1 Tax=Natronococcus wangiae TaxID=3068275 RepID=UPI00387EC36D
MHVIEDRDAVTTFDLTDFCSTGLAVVTVVAEESDEDPLSLEPLYNTIDPECLDRICSTNSSQSTDKSVKFTYQNYVVVVKANGRGNLYEPVDRLSAN